MFEIDEMPQRSFAVTVKPSRAGHGALRVARQFGCALLASSVLCACIDEPGAPSDDESDDTGDGVLEVLGFRQASSLQGISTTIYSPETTTRIFGGMASADVDLNGADDVLILGGESPSGQSYGTEFLLNGGERNFEDGSDWLPRLSPFASGAVFADLDLDGAPDLLVPNASDGSVAVFINDDLRRFEELEAGAGFEGDFAPALGAVAADVDGDLDLDVFVLRAGEPREASSAGVLWLNDGEAHFSDHSDALSDLPVQDATSALFVDVNGDLKLDLFIARSDGVTLLVNQTKSTSQLRFLQGDLGQVPELNGAFAVAAADLDDDRDFDLLLSGVGGLLTQSNAASSVADGGIDFDAPDAAPLEDAALGEPVPSDAGAPVTDPDSLDAAAPPAPNGAPGPGGGARPGPTGRDRIIDNAESGYLPWPTGQGLPAKGGAAFCVADFNNDTYLDVFQGTAPPDPDEASEVANSDAGSVSPAPGLFLQRGDGDGFIDGSSLAGLADAGEARSVLCFDYDNDGDVDILVAPFSGKVKLYENTLDPEVGPSNYVNVRVLGSDEHPSTLGAVVTIVTGSLVQTRSIGQNHTSAAQGPNLLHFGLGSSTVIDSVVIAWPDGAEESVFEDFDVNATYQFTRQ